MTTRWVHLISSFSSTNSFKCYQEFEIEVKTWHLKWVIINDDELSMMNIGTVISSSRNDTLIFCTHKMIRFFSFFFFFYVHHKSNETRYSAIKSKKDNKNKSSSKQQQQQQVIDTVLLTPSILIKRQSKSTHLRSIKSWSDYKTEMVNIS